MLSTSVPMAVGAVLTDGIIYVLQIIFVLPTAYPVTEQTLNYAPVAVGTVLVGTLVAWFLPFGWGARSWFKGELHNLTSESSVRASQSLISNFYWCEYNVCIPNSLLAWYLFAARARVAESRANCATSPVKIWCVHPNF